MAFYWYQNDPDLYQAEVMAMRKFFPQFKINQLQDGSGRLYWRGKVQPILLTAGSTLKILQFRMEFRLCLSIGNRPRIFFRLPKRRYPILSLTFTVIGCLDTLRPTQHPPSASPLRRSIMRRIGCGLSSVNVCRTSLSSLYAQVA